MTADYGHSGHADAARLLKAVALETTLTAEGVPSAAVRRWDPDASGWIVTLPDKTRRRLEKVAGVRRSSDETWLRAAELLADYEDTRVRYAGRATPTEEAP